MVVFMARLIMRRGPEKGQNFVLQEKSIQIGRGRRNDIVIEDNDVSREHCRLVKEDNVYQIYDLDSTNGTFVNGLRVNDKWALDRNCIIELGDSITLEFKLDETDKIEQDIRKTNQSMMQQYFLMVKTPSRPKYAVYPLKEKTITVGRGTNNQVIVIEPEISRNHLNLTRSRAGYFVEDTGSTNGTSINGRELNEKTLLESGDILRIGKGIVIQYTNDPDDVISQSKTEDITDTPIVGTEQSVGTNMLKPHFTNSRAQPSSVGTGILPGGLQNQVLMLYDRSEWETVIAPIVNHLMSADIEVWVEQYLSQGSDDWLVAIEQAMSECWLLVVVLNQRSIQSKYISKIWRYFHNRDKPIILIMQEDFDQLPVGAQSTQKIKYVTARKTMIKLVHAIKLLQN